MFLLLGYGTTAEDMPEVDAVKVDLSALINLSESDKQIIESKLSYRSDTPMVFKKGLYDVANNKEIFIQNFVLLLRALPKNKRQIIGTSKREKFKEMGSKALNSEEINSLSKALESEEIKEGDSASPLNNIQPLKREEESEKSPDFIELITLEANKEFIKNNAISFNNLISKNKENYLNVMAAVFNKIAFQDIHVAEEMIKLVISMSNNKKSLGELTTFINSEFIQFKNYNDAKECLEFIQRHPEIFLNVSFNDDFFKDENLSGVDVKYRIMAQDVSKRTDHYYYKTDDEKQWARLLQGLKLNVQQAEDLLKNKWIPKGSEQDMQTFVNDVLEFSETLNIKEFNTRKQLMKILQQFNVSLQMMRVLPEEITSRKEKLAALLTFFSVTGLVDEIDNENKWGTFIDKVKAAEIFHIKAAQRLVEIFEMKEREIKVINEVVFKKRALPIVGYILVELVGMDNATKLNEILNNFSNFYKNLGDAHKAVFRKNPQRIIFLYKKYLNNENILPRLNTLLKNFKIDFRGDSASMIFFLDLVLKPSDGGYPQVLLDRWEEFKDLQPDRNLFVSEAEDLILRTLNVRQRTDACHIHRAANRDMSFLWKQLEEKSQVMKILSLEDAQHKALEWLQDYSKAKDYKQRFESFIVGNKKMQDAYKVTFGDKNLTGGDMFRKVVSYLDSARNLSIVGGRTPQNMFVEQVLYDSFNAYDNDAMSCVTGIAERFIMCLDNVEGFYTHQKLWPLITREPEYNTLWNAQTYKDISNKAEFEAEFEKRKTALVNKELPILNLLEADAIAELKFTWEYIVGMAHNLGVLWDEAKALKTSAN